MNRNSQIEAAVAAMTAMTAIDGERNEAWYLLFFALKRIARGE